MKKVLTMLLVVGVMLSLFIFPVSAANTTDTDFGFFFIPELKYDYTEPRSKENSTSTYIHYQSGTAGSAIFRVYGAINTWQVPSGTAVNCTKNTEVFVWKGEKGCIRQYVYELGYNYAILYARVDVIAGSSSIAAGVWSPDTRNQSNYKHFN